MSNCNEDLLMGKWGEEPANFYMTCLKFYGRKKAQKAQKKFQY